MDDNQIMELFFAREESAIAEARQAYGSYCAAVAGKILDDPQDVEEVLSDTWLKAWNAIPPERPARLKLYLARIARNLSFDRFRSQHREKRGGGEFALALEELAECAGTRHDPQAEAETRELQQAVGQFLRELPSRDRSIFLLRYFYMESIPAIAGRFAIRQTLVRTVLSRTRKKLRLFLTKEGLLNG